MADDSLPDYEPMLEAYHQTFAAELRAMIRTLPITEGSLVLEMACGDGAYSTWLADLVGPSGQVVAFDVSPKYLELARTRSRNQDSSSLLEFVAGSIDRMPFDRQSFDAVWCAQSLFSLPEPIDAVTRMAEVVKPGGLVAVLEDDTLHQILLPWPVEIELAVRAAEWARLQEQSHHPDKFYVGRRLVGVFRTAGLVDIQVRSFATSRIGPLDGPVRKFLEAYLDNLKSRVLDQLPTSIREEFLRLIDPGSPDRLIDRDDIHLTVIDHLVYGRSPVGDQSY